MTPKSLPSLPKNSAPVVPRKSVETWESHLVPESWLTQSTKSVSSRKLASFTALSHPLMGNTSFLSGKEWVTNRFQSVIENRKLIGNLYMVLFNSREGSNRQPLQSELLLWLRNFRTISYNPYTRIIFIPPPKQLFLNFRWNWCSVGSTSDTWNIVDARAFVAHYRTDSFGNSRWKIGDHWFVSKKKLLLFSKEYIGIIFGCVMCNYLLLQQSVIRWTQMVSIFLVSPKSTWRTKRKDHHPQFGMRCLTIILRSASTFITEGPHEMKYYVDGNGRSFFDQDIQKWFRLFVASCNNHASQEGLKEYGMYEQSKLKGRKRTNISSENTKESWRCKRTIQKTARNLFSHRGLIKCRRRLCLCRSSLHIQLEPRLQNSSSGYRKVYQNQKLKPKVRTCMVSS